MMFRRDRIIGWLAAVCAGAFVVSCAVLALVPWMWLWATLVLVSAAALLGVVVLAWRDRPPGAKDGTAE